jgi:hypothetical protein
VPARDDPPRFEGAGGSGDVPRSRGRMDHDGALATAYAAIRVSIAPAVGSSPAAQSAFWIARAFRAYSAGYLLGARFGCFGGVTFSCEAPTWCVSLTRFAALL